MKATGEAITRLLAGAKEGNRAAAAELMPLIYDQLRRIAASYMRAERPGHTLQATALVNEAWLRLDQERGAWQSRAHFFSVAAQVMRWILYDHARRHRASKRGEGRQVELKEGLALSDQRSAEVLALEEALQRLEALDERQARIVELRYYFGLEIEETAELLAISPATVKREWALARAWLRREIGDAG